MNQQLGSLKTPPNMPHSRHVINLIILGADKKDNADNARINITFSCDNDKCQIFEELEAQNNLVEFGTEEANSLPCKRQFKFADDLMDHIK